ncbi:BamA/TamA family outer membrane protein [Aquabacterium fontiphilum]|uniref:autotransporter assembly complex protein TamA n=1 Tax=Aquabacterium fontiphilum TaxID=450365 RepID=UPI00137711F2|nr:BamA/TamA family outer membrane protein [Aquabacterium fontiphilum]NBD19842.1 BamA/TamA family outer membrane protein [Aquabacterium fontiphilum]
MTRLRGRAGSAACVAAAWLWSCGVAVAQEAAVAPRDAAAADLAPPLAAQPLPATAGGQAATRAPVVWQLKVVAPDELRALLLQYLDLARFQDQKENGEPVRVSRAELRRLVAAVPEQSRALLEAEGYFGARVAVRVDDPGQERPQLVTVTVEPGPRARIRSVRFVFEGELDQQLDAEDTYATGLLERLEREWALPAGALFSQGDWSAAKNAALARLRSESYPTATWSGTSVTVDASTHEARLFLVADSGPEFRFGTARVEGLRAQPASAVLNLAPFRPGERYSEQLLLDWQERIQKLNLFEGVFVSADLDPTQAEAAPVVVQLRELPLQAATLGVGVSSDTGPRVSVEHLHRNAFGLGWQARTKAQLGSKASDAQLDLTSHPWEGRRRGLISLQAARFEDTFNAINTSQRVRVGRLREGERLERTSYLELQHAAVRDRDGQDVSNATALSGTAQWILREVDNQVLPTRGYTSLTQLTLGRTYASRDEEGWFSRVYGKVNAYLPLPNDWHLSVRAEAGQVFTPGKASVPDPLLFRAGGDESVRGYAFRSLGVNRDGIVVGGRSMYTGSVELAHPLPKLPPSVWGAVFADVGDAGERFKDLQARTGYGFGVRWRSPVGPLRLDLAYGTKVSQWRLHFSVGISL